MTACPRPHCRGAVGATWTGNCHLCARPETPARAATAEEKHSRGRGAEQEPDYFSGIYRVGYVPTAEELSRAEW